VAEVVNEQDVDHGVGFVDHAPKFVGHGSGFVGHALGFVERIGTPVVCIVTGTAVHTGAPTSVMCSIAAEIK
jgi:hypothetical protein